MSEKISKVRLKEIVKDIYKKDRADLEKFRINFYKSDIDEKATKHIKAAIEDRLLQLDNGNDKFSVMAVDSELSTDEVKRI